MQTETARAKRFASDAAGRGGTIRHSNANDAMTFRTHARPALLPRTTNRLLAGLLVLCAGLILAACQSSGTEALEDVAPGPAMAQERIGEGGVTVALLLPRSASGETARRARDLRDGAALALSDLGAGRISLIVYDTGGRAGEVAGLVGQARAAGARLIIGPAIAQTSAALVAVEAGQRPPAIAFVGNGEPRGAGVFALVTDPVDSALEAVRAAVTAGHRNFLAIVPQGFPASDLTRLSQGVSAARGQFAGQVGYGGNDIAGQVAARREALVKADAVIIFGAGDQPAQVAAALRASAALQPGAVLIGNAGWAQSNFARPELEGALVAMPDQSGVALIAERYRAAAGRAPTSDSSYGYDAVAVAAGIVRSMGEGALTAATLTQRQGFRGTTGIFRFEADGSVSRPLALYRLRNGAAHLIDPTPAGF